MYDFFEGRVAECSPTLIVLDVGGVGYRLSVPVSTYERVREAQREGRPTKVYAHLQLSTQQDDLRLFGFGTEAERRLFEALIKVQGVGPASALTVLSGSSPSDIVRAIRDGDARFFQRMKGVGKKTAERVIVELREKAHLLLPATPADHAAPGSSSDDAVRALMSLGFTPQVGRKAVDKAAATLPDDAPVEALIKEALRHVK